MQAADKKSSIEYRTTKSSRNDCVQWALSVENKQNILTTITRDIQCEEFIEDGSVSYLMMYSVLQDHPNPCKLQLLGLKIRTCTTPDTKNK